jgi:pimeloyl-ACP methyl ester carboxylesterase
MLWGRRLHVPSVRKVVESHYKSSKLFVVANCGHVVNVEQPNVLTRQVLSFMELNKKMPVSSDAGISLTTKPNNK